MGEDENYSTRRSAANMRRHHLQTRQAGVAPSGLNLATSITSTESLSSWYPGGTTIQHDGPESFKPWPSRTAEHRSPVKLKPSILRNCRKCSLFDF